MKFVIGETGEPREEYLRLRFVSHESRMVCSRRETLGPSGGRQLFYVPVADAGFFSGGIRVDSKNGIISNKFTLH